MPLDLVSVDHLETAEMRSASCFVRGNTGCPAGIVSAESWSASVLFLPPKM